MKKGIKTFLITIVFICGVFLITGCGKNSNPLEGKWAHGSFVYTFNDDKTCVYDSAGTKMECTYEIDGENLSILYKGNTEPFKTSFKVEGKKLTIKDSLGSDVEYEKK